MRRCLVTVTFAVLVSGGAAVVRAETHAPAALTDAQVERILLEGRIVEIEDVGAGVTKPQRVTLELDGVQRRAIFKSLDVQKRGITRMAGAPPEMNYSDSYLYERAAYLLDRELGLGMVPVAVLRDVGGSRGALVDWVEGAITEGERLERKIDIGPEVRREIAAMRVFDMLINNADRNRGNLLYAEQDWSVFLIDHTRAFRYPKGWPADYDEIPIQLPREMLPRLEALELKPLASLLDGVVTRDRIKSLLARRDRLLKLIEEQRELRGDAFVFLEVTE
jgi:hypothetical protein